MIFSFCFQGGEEQDSILLATTGDRWRQSGLDRPDSTVIFAFFHIRSFAVPREVCMIVGFQWFSTFLPGWGSFAGIWRARHVVSKCNSCDMFVILWQVVHLACLGEACQGGFCWIDSDRFSKVKRTSELIALRKIDQHGPVHIWHPVYEVQGWCKHQTVAVVVSDFQKL